MNIIEIDQLSKSFKGKKGARVNALKDISLVLPSSEVFGFIGPNGAGKSTTIKILMGLIKPTSGMARIMGLPVTDHTSRLSVGYLPENPSFFDFLTAFEYLCFIGQSFKMPTSVIQSKAEEVLHKLDLWDARNRPVRGYSKGMVQRLGIAQVLIHNPDLYILDEPMSGLDPLGRTLVKSILNELKGQGKTVFFSTHIISDVESICDSVGIIINGNLVETMRVDKISHLASSRYSISYTLAGCIETKSIEAHELSTTITSIISSGAEIISVDPIGSKLEDYFIKKINEHKI